MTDLENYLSLYDYGNKISNPELWNEMDRVWDKLKLNNKINLNKQNIGEFYSHPVWVLNGLFSENDLNSFTHRKLVVDYVFKFFNSNIQLKIADFGGGSGVLGKIFEESNINVDKIDIIEPWPSEYFLYKLKNYNKIHFINNFKSLNYYDVTIAQDVLEHVENPIEVAFKCFEATKNGGIIIFANCFYPVIKCHLPRNFYLRFLFKYVVISKNLKFIGRVDGTTHMEVYQKLDTVRLNGVTKIKIIIAKTIGNSLNFIYNLYKKK